MKIRRIQYSIDVFHMLNFRNEYKDIVTPFFNFKDLKYGIDNDGTMLETIRLIFNNENIIIYFRKEGLSIIHEGDPDDLNNSPIMQLFWELNDGMRQMKSYSATDRQTIIIHAVDVRDKKSWEEMYQKQQKNFFNPFGELEDFAINYEFKRNDGDQEYKFQFGKYSKRDIQRHELTPFKTEYNEDLKDDSIGFMCRIELRVREKSPSPSKYKQVLNMAKKEIKQYYPEA